VISISEILCLRKLGCFFILVQQHYRDFDGYEYSESINMLSQAYCLHIAAIGVIIMGRFITNRHEMSRRELSAHRLLRASTRKACNGFSFAVYKDHEIRKTKRCIIK
jgi:hypothetical protein